MRNLCLICGEEVPEGRQICPICENLQFAAEGRRMKRHKPKHRIEMRSCGGCRWYASFEGVCCNAESDYCADWPPYRCELYDAAESAERDRKAQKAQKGT